MRQHITVTDWKLHRLLILEQINIAMKFFELRHRNILVNICQTPPNETNERSYNSKKTVKAHPKGWLNHRPIFSICYGQPGMWSPYFLWDCDSGLDNLGLYGPKKKLGLRQQLQAQNQTPTPTLGLIVWHIDCVLKDELRNVLNSSNNVVYTKAYKQNFNWKQQQKGMTTGTLHKVARPARTVHQPKPCSIRFNVQSRSSTCLELS